MREPWLFWTSLAILPFAGVCFLLALRVTSDRLRVSLEIVSQTIGGAAAIAMGYESAFRMGAKDFWELKTNTAVGLFFILAGVFALAEAVAKVLGK
jgi:hypothetical protein